MSPKYIIFAGSDFYPSGGFLDYYGFAETEDEAIYICNEAISINSKYTKNYRGDELGVDQNENQIYGRADWSHFVCVANNKIIATYRRKMNQLNK